MWDESAAGRAARERLSALLDGELEHPGVVHACGHWRDDAGSRASWHAYHLIGDVLRSEDLASQPARDAVFLTRLRARMAAEPVVLAPGPHPETSPAHGDRDAASDEPVRSRRGGRGGRVGMAVAAGFLAVAGLWTLSRPGAAPDQAPGATLAQAASGTSPLPVPAEARAFMASADVSSSAENGGEPQKVVASGQLVRDARLDRYLAAHQQFAGSSALSLPSAYLRNAAAEMSGR